MSLRVTLGNGKQRQVRRLWTTFPFDIFVSEPHREISKRLAERDDQAPDRASLANLLFAKSWRTRELTILWWMCERRPTELVSLICPYSRETLEHLLGRRLPPHITVIMQGDETPDVTVAQVAIVMLKAMLHRCYRLLGYRGGRLKRDSAIRAYGELSSRLYRVEQESACVLIYPVAYGWEAHRRYVRRMLRTHPAAIRAGLPYSFRALAATLLARPLRRGTMLARAEVAAGTAHATELRKSGVITLYAADEFEVSAFALHSAFQRAGGRSVNTAHGIGVYAAQTCYAEFRVMTTSQQRYYGMNHPETQFVFSSVTSRRPAANRVGLFHPGVILIDQYTSFREYPYESRAQAALLKLLLETAPEAGLSVAIKAHPTVSRKLGRAMAQRTGVPVFHAWEDLPVRNPILVGIKSTVLLECMGLWPTFAYDDGLLMPELYFGDSVARCTRENLAEILHRLAAETGWSHEVRKQEAMLRRNTGQERASDTR